MGFRRRHLAGGFEALPRKEGRAYSSGGVRNVAVHLARFQAAALLIGNAEHLAEQVLVVLAENRRGRSHAPGGVREKLPWRVDVRMAHAVRVVEPRQHTPGLGVSIGNRLPCCPAPRRSAPRRAEAPPLPRGSNVPATTRQLSRPARRGSPAAPAPPRTADRPRARACRWRRKAPSTPHRT